MANPDSSASAGEQFTHNPASLLAAAQRMANQIGSAAKTAGEVAALQWQTASDSVLEAANPLLKAAQDTGQAFVETAGSAVKPLAEQANQVGQTALQTATATAESVVSATGQIAGQISQAVDPAAVGGAFLGMSAGQVAGGMVGGAIGSALGPGGAVLGAQVGAFAGSATGAKLGYDVTHEIVHPEPDKAQRGANPFSRSERFAFEIAEHLSKKSGEKLGETLGTAGAQLWGRSSLGLRAAW